MEFLENLINAIKEMAPAAAIAIYEYLMNKVKRQEIETQKVELTLAELEAKDATDARFADRSDDDIVDERLGRKDPK